MKSIPALITPFKADREIDYDLFANLVEWQIAEGSDALLIHGTTGEAPTITAHEFSSLITRAKEVIRNRVPLLVGTGTNATSTSIEKTLIAKNLGADMALAVVPYYNLPSDQGCFLHFKKIAEETQFPFIIYYHPGRTGKKLSIDTLVSFLSIPNVYGIKDSSLPETIEKIIQRVPDAKIYSGVDETTLASLEAGAVGSISVFANAFPRLWKTIIENRSQEDFNTLTHLMQAVFAEVNPVGIKALLHAMQKCEPYVRLPLVESAHAIHYDHLSLHR